MTNVFGEVYENLQHKSGAPNKSLFNALNSEDVQTIILHDGVWWTEQHSSSKGLSPAQHLTLKALMKRTYNAPWLHDTAPTPTLELHHAS